MFPLEICNLSKKYGPLLALDNVSLQVNQGEIFGLLGPNGAGKTSLISCVVTLEEPSQGNCHVFGKDVSACSQWTKSQVGYVPQEVIYHGYFTVREILQFHSGYFGIWENEKHIDFLLSRLGLEKHQHKRVKALSGGMKRRLLVAKALVHKPNLLLLDEPTAGVDVDLRSSLWDFVNELKDLGHSILLTTHYLEEAEALCDRVGILNHGKLLKVGETRSLIQDSTARQVLIHLRHPLPPLQHPCLIKQESHSLTLSLPSKKGMGDLLSELSLDLSIIQDLEIEEGNLEDAFKKVIEESTP